MRQGRGRFTDQVIGGYALGRSSVAARWARSTRPERAPALGRDQDALAGLARQPEPRAALPSRAAHRRALASPNIVEVLEVGEHAGPVSRDGAARGPDARRAPARRAAPSPAPSSSSSSARSAPASPPRPPPASSIATSSRRTSSSTDGRGRSSTSASRARSIAATRSPRATSSARRRTWRPSRRRGGKVDHPPTSMRSPRSRTARMTGQPPFAARRDRRDALPRRPHRAPRRPRDHAGAARDRSRHARSASRSAPPTVSRPPPSSPMRSPPASRRTCRHTSARAARTSCAPVRGRNPRARRRRGSGPSSSASRGSRRASCPRHPDRSGSYRPCWPGPPRARA